MEEGQSAAATAARPSSGSRSVGSAARGMTAATGAESGRRAAGGGGGPGAALLGSAERGADPSHRGPGRAGAGAGPRRADAASGAGVCGWARRGPSGTCLFNVSNLLFELRQSRTF